jgi:RHS repeat-associated protein
MRIDSSPTALRACARVSLFTGKERDAESGLDYFGTRYYASNMGRWMSPTGHKTHGQSRSAISTIRKAWTSAAMWATVR